MSEENVDLMRRAYETFNRGGIEPTLELIDELVDPDFELRAVLHLPDVDRTSGREAGKAIFREVYGAFDWHLEPEEFIDAGDAVLVVARGTSRGKASGLEVTNRVVHAWGVRRGKVTYFDAYRTKEEALEAAGLSEGAHTPPT
jgi:ketosteroid isomerase-like protein